MDRFNSTNRSAFSKASNLILNQTGYKREGAPGGGMVTPSGFMSGTNKQDQPQQQDERQIKSQIDYNDKRSYYAPSSRSSKRSGSTGRQPSSILSKANLKNAFGAASGNAGGNHARSKTFSVYSRPTTSAAMSVVSHATSNSLYSGQKSKATGFSKSYVQDDSILESSDQDDDEDEDNDDDDEDDDDNDNQGEFQANHKAKADNSLTKNEQNKNKDQLNQQEALAKAQRQQAKKKKRQLKKKRREQKKMMKQARKEMKQQMKKKLSMQQKDEQEGTPKIPSQISVPDGYSQASYMMMRDQIKTAGVQQPRKWKQGLGEKLVEKDYGDQDDRMDKINRRLQKERQKALVGQRMHRDNMKILQEMRSVKNSKLSSSSSSVVSASVSFSGQSSVSKKPRLVPKFSNSLRISSGIVRDQQLPEIQHQPMVSSSHSVHTREIFDKKGVKTDKLNFRRLNIFGAYVNASFKGGVFHGAPTDSA